MQWSGTSGSTTSVDCTHRLVTLHPQHMNDIYPTGVSTKVGKHLATHGLARQTLIVRSQEGCLGIVILIGIGIVSAALWHHFVPRFAVATIAATTTTVVLFQIGAYMDLGYLDRSF